MNMDTISSDRHLKDLHRLYDHTKSHVQSLMSLGIEAASYGAFLSPVLLSKLPPELRLIVSRKVSDSNLNMDALLSTFEEELTARERANPQLTQRTMEKPHHTSSVLFSGIRNAKVEPQCCYCQQSHPSPSCTIVNNPADRKQVLKTSGRCFNCLLRSLVSQNCRSSSRCHKCNKNHHTSICDVGLTTHSITNSTLNPEAEPFTTVPTTTTFCSDNVRTVFLQTARAIIHHPSKPHNSLGVRIILDGGSQKSYLSEHAQDLLKLEPTGEQALSIATFGSSKGTTKVCPIVNIGLSQGLPIHVTIPVCNAHYL